MSWVRIDDAFDDNPKVEELSDAAFRLYVTTLCWCSRHSTDGHVTLTVAKKRGTLKAIRELLDANLWLEIPGGYEVNDYLAYNPSKAEVAARREAIGKRVRKHRGNGNCNAVTDDAQTALPKESETPLPRAGARDAGVRARVSRPDPSPGEIPLPPSEPSNPRPDPFMASMTGRRTQDDPGVIAVFEAWKLAHGFTGAKLRQPADARADVLFEAVTTHGVEDCLRVLEASKTDAMVTGKADEQGQEHRSVEYIFKPTTFDRLLREADKHQASKPLGAAEVMRRARLA